MIPGICLYGCLLIIVIVVAGVLLYPILKIKFSSSDGAALAAWMSVNPVKLFFVHELSLAIICSKT